MNALTGVHREREQKEPMNVHSTTNDSHDSEKMIIMKETEGEKK